MSTPKEPLDVVVARHGGEDAAVKARERFRQVTQGALDEFRDAILGKTAAAEGRWSLIFRIDKVRRTLMEAAREYIETLPKS